MRQFLRYIVCLVFLLSSVSVTAYAQSEEEPEVAAEGSVQEAEAESADAVAGSAESADSAGSAQDAGSAKVADAEGATAKEGAEEVAESASEKNKEAAEDDALLAYADFVIALEACGTFQDPEDKSYTRPGICTGTLDKSKRLELARDNPECLPECDVDKLYNLLDVMTRNALVMAYATLVKIDTIIETYFDSIEHSHMRARTGTNILKDPEHPVKSASDLFKYLFKPEKLIINKHVISGLQLVKQEIINPNQVRIQTHMNGQVFTMTRSDGVWQTDALLNSIVAAVEPIMVSSDEMQKYAKDNITEEYERRAAVLKYFLLQSEVRRRQALEFQRNQAKSK